ncbi:type II toxin-antitoxin system HicA family toxin [Natrinema sp. 74]|uniref:type II toxin-antitoxin system HicA family toxin n=1 Tax=Natrinema sp. 74 TaxID=3384159 RepID=UPI0038D4A87E
MPRRQFTGEEVAKVLINMGYAPVDRTGSHLKLRYEHPKTGEVRNVTIPLGGEIRTGTLRNIADQCGANDFDSWCRWVDEHR